jgi:competence protein ComFC
VKKLIKRLKNTLISYLYPINMLDLLFPSFCINCKRPGEYLCPICQKKLKNSLPECYVCRKISNKYKTHTECNTVGLDAVFVGWQYDETAKKILSEYKYKYAYKLSEIITKLLYGRLENTRFIECISPNSIFVPIPIHKSHQNSRGFNQSTLIAQKLSGKMGLDLEENLLIRDKDSHHQSQADYKKRKDLGDVFSLTREIKNKDIIIVDDVITTGTTINRIAKTLTGNNLKAIALFRGRPRYNI